MVILQAFFNIFAGETPSMPMCDADESRPAL